MSVQKLDIKNIPNQIINTSVNINGTSVPLVLTLRFNSMANYWTVDIKDTIKDELVIVGMPLLSNNNLLGQYGYLRIGSCGMLNIGNVNPDVIDMTNFGKDFVWVWWDNE